MRLPFRTLVFWLHLACGLVAGSVILLMSVTGVLLTYQKQMTEWSDRGYWSEAPSGVERVPISRAIEEAARLDPEARVTRVTIHADPDAPLAVQRQGRRTLYLDAYTGEVRGEATEGMRSFFSLVVGLHRWFALTGEARTPARAVTGWSNLVFLALLSSGLYLWIPRSWTWAKVRAVLLLNPKARGKARDFNWHHVAGFWFAVPLVVVVASATVISFPWASNLAYRLAGEAPPVRGAAPPAPAEDRATDAPPPEPFDPSRLDALVPPATAKVAGWRTLTFEVPETAGSTVAVQIDRSWGGDPQERSTLHLDPAGGEEVGYEAFGDRSRGQRFRTWLRFAHTGEVFGLGGQTLAGLASLAGVFLVWTGLALAWRRFLRFVRRQRRSSGPERLSSVPEETRDGSDQEVDADLGAPHAAGRGR